MIPMGCNCSKNQPAPRGSTASRASAQEAANKTADAARAARDRAANPSTSRIGPVSASGATQQFALRTRDGQVQSFGSALGARAERIRRGGEIIP
jgi:hypothetical protein